MRTVLAIMLLVLVPVVALGQILPAGPSNYTHLCPFDYDVVGPRIEIILAADTADTLFFTKSTPAWRADADSTNWVAWPKLPYVAPGTGRTEYVTVPTAGVMVSSKIKLSYSSRLNGVYNGNRATNGVRQDTTISVVDWGPGGAPLHSPTFPTVEFIAGPLDFVVFFSDTGTDTVYVDTLYRYPSWTR